MVAACYIAISSLFLFLQSVFLFLAHRIYVSIQFRYAHSIDLLFQCDKMQNQGEYVMMIMSENTPRHNLNWIPSKSSENGKLSWESKRSSYSWGGIARREKMMCNFLMSWSGGKWQCRIMIWFLDPRWLRFRWFECWCECCWTLVWMRVLWRGSARY